MFDFEMLEKFEQIDRELDREWRMMFGEQENPPEHEMNIAWDTTLTLAEKLEKLALLRGEKKPKSKTFAKRLTKDDKKFARALGIELQ